MPPFFVDYRHFNPRAAAGPESNGRRGVRDDFAYTIHRNHSDVPSGGDCAQRATRLPGSVWLDSRDDIFPVTLSNPAPAIQATSELELLSHI